jgi:phosphate transport system protein
VELAGSVYEILLKALATLEDPEQQEDWRSLDNKIDKERDQILDQIVDIMTLQQLRAQELRWMLGYQRMAQELERIADYACDIAELSGMRPEGHWVPEILYMAAHLSIMYEHVLGVIKEEQEIFVDINDEDDELDRSYASLQKKLRVNYQDQSISGELGLALILARTLERLGDHLVNVGEMQVYIKTGRRRLSRQG